MKNIQVLYELRNLSDNIKRRKKVSSMLNKTLLFSIIIGILLSLVSLLLGLGSTIFIVYIVFICIFSLFIGNYDTKTNYLQKEIIKTIEQYLRNVIFQAIKDSILPDTVRSDIQYRTQDGCYYIYTISLYSNTPLFVELDTLLKPTVSDLSKAIERDIKVYYSILPIVRYNNL